MTCAPPYSYRPVFINDPETKCAAPRYRFRRSRAFVGGSYFRSKNQGQDQNNITLQVIDNNNGTFTLFVTRGLLNEQFTVNQSLSGDLVTCDPNAIILLRTAVNNSSNIIEMPMRGNDVNDTGVDSPCLSTFGPISMSGGEGPSSTGIDLSSIRTGPERTVIIVSSKEDIQGNDVQPPPSEQIQQWDGTQWISYCNNVQGTCPGNGNC